MYKTLTLTLLLVSAVCLQAQMANPSSDAGKTSSPTTIQGCLQFSDNHYRLTDSSGKTYQLSHEVNKLTHYVGQQVEVTGKSGVRTVDTTGAGTGESTAKEQPVFFVKSVKQIAATCTSAGH